MAGARCGHCGGATAWTPKGTCPTCSSFPTLGYQVADLIQARCVIPDGELAGEPYLLTDEMLRFLLWFYRLNPTTGRFVYDRGAQLERPQKWGKGPFSAAWIIAEADPDGPVRPDGWDSYGEPVGKPVPTPWIQVAAYSEDQTDNVWSALLPMIERGSLAADIPDTGVTRINLPSGGKIEPVTSAAGSRLGQRITGAVQDQPESWTESNGGRKLADTQRRNLAGMGGRFLETCNAYDPADNSVSQQTAEGNEPGVYIDTRDPGEGSVRNRQHRRRMLKRVYGDSWWVDLDRIDSEIEALIKRDPAQAERFFLNRHTAGDDRAFDHPKYEKLADPAGMPDDGSRIVVGVDGARFIDSLALVATDIVTAFQWPLGIWTRPAKAGDAYEHPFVEVDGAMRDAFDRYRVWRVYIDPQWIDHLVDEWQGRWGEKRVIAWWTNRNRQIAYAVRNYATAIGAGDFRHSGDALLSAHIRNARKRKVPIFDERLVQMHTISKDRSDSPNKMDGAMASVLSWEALGDARALGLHNKPTEPLIRVGRSR